MSGLGPRIKCLVPIQPSSGGELTLQVALLKAVITYIIHENVPLRVGFAGCASPGLMKKTKKQPKLQREVHHHPFHRLLAETYPMSVPPYVQIRREKKKDEKKEARQARGTADTTCILIDAT